MIAASTETWRGCWSASECLGSKLIRADYLSPWQNGGAARWVATCPRELLDHVIVLNESHCGGLSEYLQYYHEDRVHDGLNKETPTGRVLEPRQSDAARVVGEPQLALQMPLADPAFACAVVSPIRILDFGSLRLGVRLFIQPQ
jgi:hypothetical protein